MASSRIEPRSRQRKCGGQATQPELWGNGEGEEQAHMSAQRSAGTRDCKFLYSGAPLAGSRSGAGTRKLQPLLRRLMPPSDSRKSTLWLNLTVHCLRAPGQPVKQG